MVLTPTVLPNSFGVPPDLPVPYLFQARGLPRYGFCALEMPLNSFVFHLPVCGQFLPPVLLISYSNLLIFLLYHRKETESTVFNYLVFYFAVQGVLQPPLFRLRTFFIKEKVENRD